MRRLMVLLFAVSGCAEEVAPDAIDAELLPSEEAPPPVVNGCGDATVYLRNPADTAAIVLDIPGIVAAAHGAPAPIRRSVQLPDPLLSGEQWRGARVTSATCTGVVVPPGPNIRLRKPLVGGTVTLIAVPSVGFPGMPPGADLDITLQDPEFQEPNGVVTVMRGTFTFPTVMAGGFYP